MEKVTGYLSFDVEVNCPYCNTALYLNEIPYGELESNNELGMALFGSHTKVSQWENLNIKYECTRCKKEFILEQIEY